ncbi:MAG: cyclic nucleotide-binding domain-containing protein [Myxococcota bacterium]
MASRKVEILRERLNRSLRGGKLEASLPLYEELQALDPDEPRWPHRKGDLLQRLDRKSEAVGAYERAVDLYAAQGFLPRAVAMAKVVLGIDPSRSDVLARVDPATAKRLHDERRPEPSAAVQAAFRAESSPDLSQTGFRKLTPHPDTSTDEVRFEDGPSIELDLSELEFVDREVSLPEFFLEEEDEKSAEELALLPGLPLFAELPQEHLIWLAQESELIQLADGAPLIRAGDPADALFAIVEGSVGVHVPGMPEGADAILAEGDIVGEACLLDDVKRRADVFVQGRLSALKLRKGVLDELVRRHPPTGTVLFELYTRRVVANLLSTSELFSAFDAETQKEIARLFEARRADERQTLIEAGKRSDGLYILLAGRLLLRAPEEMRKLEPVTVVGQHSLMGDGIADYSVSTETDALLLRLSSSAFGRLAALYPPVLATLSDLASRSHEKLRAVSLAPRRRSTQEY